MTISINAPDDLKILIQDPRSSTPGLGLLLWIKTVYGDKAADVWEKLSARIVTVTKGWSEAYGMFMEGQAQMVLSYTTSPAYHIAVEETDKYKAAPFADGHYMQVETGRHYQGEQKQGTGQSVPSLPDWPAGPEHHPHHQLDVSGGSA